MNAIPLTKIEGDTTVSRNAAMGGNVRVGGSALIKHGLRVEGWADLLNIKGCNKGLFESFEALKTAYPQPKPGWWAMTYATTGSGETLEATYTMYMVEEGVWVSKGTTTTPQEFDTQLFQYLEDFDNLEKRDDELAAAIDAEEAAREATDRNLAESIAQEVADREDADAALEDRLDAEVTARSEADTALGGRIDTESTARVTADEALANDISKVAGDLAEEAVTRLDQITALRDDLEAEMQNCRDADEALANAIADALNTAQVADSELQEQIAEHRRELHYLPDNFSTEKALFTAAGTYTIGTQPIKPGALLLGCVDECWGVYQYVYFDDEVEVSAQSEEAVQAASAAAPTIAPPAVKHDANVSNPENWVRLATIEDVAALKKLVPVVEITADEIAALLPADELQIATLEFDVEDEAGAGADQPATCEALERFRTRLRQMRGRSVFKPKEVYNPNDYINYEHE